MNGRDPSRRPYRSLIAGAATLLAAGCTSVPMEPGTGPADPGPGTGGFSLRPDYLYYRSMWKNYREQRGSESRLDGEIAACRNAPGSCPPLFQAWVKTIDLVNLLPPEDKMERLATLLTAVANLTTTDLKKTTTFNALFHEGNWMQTPSQTLIDRKGKVGCSDVAALIYETALRTGFAGDDPGLMGGFQPSGGYHTVATVKLDNVKYVMDATVNFKAPDKSGAMFPEPILAKYDDYVTGIKFSNWPGMHKTPQFTSLFTMNESGIKIVGSFIDVVATPFRPAAKPHMIDPVELILLGSMNTMNMPAIDRTASEIRYLIDGSREGPAAVPPRPKPVSARIR